MDTNSFDQSSLWVIVTPGRGPGEETVDTRDRHHSSPHLQCV